MISGWLCLIGSVMVCVVGAKVIRHFEEQIDAMERERRG